MKRLNNKGFTLVELLAVVVILAVVMGIAMTSVISSMNKARGGSLQDSAVSIARSFSEKYTESLVDNTQNTVYKLGTGFAGYNFSNSATYYLSDKLVDEFGIKKNDYEFNATTTALTTVPADGFEHSFLSFDASTGKVFVCLVAKSTGSYYVNAYKSTLSKTIPVTNSAFVYTTDSTTGNTTKVATKMKTGLVYACNDGSVSWK